MKNSSDIFFLKDSENPVSDLWSIKGTSPMKIRRRPTTAQNDCFEYGRNNLDSSTSVIDDDKSDMKSSIPPSEVPSTENQQNSDVIQGSGCNSGADCRKKKSTIRKNVKRESSDEVSSSNIARNPITGCGMDVHCYKYSKKKMYNHLAIRVKDVEKSYGSNIILNKICLNVPKGSIYGLLGSSGCGKTTLLNCIVGRSKIDKGEIHVLGEKPHGPLGARVGYMPQEISLVSEFTVKDSIYFFGRLYNLSDETINNRYHELVELLELPKDGRYIKHCSGGTQRRISFAVSLVHKPELLLLDEPTVGTDPILRNRVWKYLLKISQEDKTTVIITTHYIEETRQANQIGLMRDGTILSEDNPDRLLSMYNCGTLEDVFLILSKKQDEKKHNKGLPGTELEEIIPKSSVSPAPSQFSIESAGSLDVNCKSTDALSKTAKIKNHNLFAMHRFKALMDKNWKRLRRNRLGTLFPILMPGLQVICFLIAVGRDVTDVPFGIVNEERSQDFCKNFSLNESVVRSGEWDCHINSISCRFVDFLNIPLIEEKFYDSSDNAMVALKSGKIYGFVHLHKNLSNLMEDRLVDGLDVDDLPDEEIQVYLDMSSLHVGGTLKLKIAERYQDFTKQVHEDCNFSPNAVKLPLRMEEYFYGDKDEEFVIFMTPGIVTTMIYFMGVMMTCAIILDEKCEGIWDRSIVAGVTSVELSLSHLIFQTTIMAFMALELIIIVFFCFQQPYVGSLWLIFMLIYMQGLAGVVLGFGISIVSDNHVTANIIVSGLFNPLVIASGVMWPAEAINEYMLAVVKCLPLTLPTTALRNIIKKGLTFFEYDTLYGFGILCLWIIICGVLSVYCVKRKQ